MFPSPLPSISIILVMIASRQQKGNNDNSYDAGKNA